MPNDSEIMSLAYNENRIYVLQKDGAISDVEVLYQEDMPYFDEPYIYVIISLPEHFSIENKL